MRIVLALWTTLFVWIVMGVFPTAARGQELTQDEALELAFPGAEFERHTAYLDDAQLERASGLAGPDIEIDSGIITHYLAVEGGQVLGVAYFDAHRVRSHREVLMIVVDLDDRIRRIETVVFREPREYQAPNSWLRQFDDRPLNAALSIKGAIAPITGATLTARAVTRAARRVLALHEVIDPFGETNR